MAAIEAGSLTKHYGNHIAINGIDLIVHRGEVFGLLGPNGAGKSTAINMLLGYVTPSEGAATVLGHDVQSEHRIIREKIGVVPERYALYERLTGLEHLKLAGGLKGVDVDTAAVLDRVGLSVNNAERRTAAYSTGMRQRLALGMAIIGDPELLILDEPTSGLDPHGVTLLKQLIREEAADGTAVFLSSHVLDYVESVCDRVGILNDGQLAAVGSIDELRNAADSESTDEVSLTEVFDAYTSGPESETGQSITSIDEKEVQL